MVAAREAWVAAQQQVQQTLVAEVAVVTLTQQQAEAEFALSDI